MNLRRKEYKCASQEKQSRLNKNLEKKVSHLTAYEADILKPRGAPYQVYATTSTERLPVVRVVMVHPEDCVERLTTLPRGFHSCHPPTDLTGRYYEDRAGNAAQLDPATCYTSATQLVRRPQVIVHPLVVGQLCHVLVSTSVVTVDQNYTKTSIKMVCHRNSWSFYNAQHKTRALLTLITIKILKAAN